MTGRVKRGNREGLSQNDSESKGEGTEGHYLRMTERVKEREQRGLSQNDRESKGEGTERVISD